MTVESPFPTKFSHALERSPAIRATLSSTNTFTAITPVPEPDSVRVRGASRRQALFESSPLPKRLSMREKGRRSANERQGLPQASEGILVVRQGNFAGFMVRKSSSFPPLQPKRSPCLRKPALTRHFWLGRVLALRNSSLLTQESPVL